MGARFKCKKCKQKFDIAAGREHIQACISACEKSTCPLRGKSLSYLPKKKETPLLVENKKASNDEEIVEVFEEEPIGGLISHREITKRHGRK